MSEKSYEVIDEGTAIACLLCQFVSENREDVRRRHCPNCGVYHDTAAKKAAEEEDGKQPEEKISKPKAKIEKHPPHARAIASKFGAKRNIGHGHFTKRRLY